MILLYCVRTCECVINYRKVTLTVKVLLDRFGYEYVEAK